MDSMYQNQNLTKNQKKKLKRSAKRKASGSPELDINSHYLCAQSGTSTQQTGLYNSNDYVNSVMMNQNSASPVLNIGHYPAMGFQNTGSPSVFPQSTQNNIGPPSWALPMLEDIRALKTVIPEIENIGKTVSCINLKLSEMETQFKDLEVKVNVIEESVQFRDKEFENMKKDLKRHSESLKKAEELNHKMKKVVDDMETRSEHVTDKILEMEARSMKDNLIFYGLNEPAKPKEGESIIPDDCEKLVKDLLNDTLNMDSTTIEFNKIHRLGGAKAKKPRPIIVNFRRFADRESIRLKSYDEDIKKKLNDNKQGVGVQMPQVYRDARRALSEKIPAGQEPNARIFGNKLYINNKLFMKYHDGKIYDCY